MSAYYYLVTGLPDISIDDNKLSYTPTTFRSELEEHLSSADKKIIDLHYLQYDNQALLSILRKDTPDSSLPTVHSLSALQHLVDSLQGRSDEPVKEKFTPYIYSFLDAYFQLEAPPTHEVENLLAGKYYAYALQCKNDFCREWFAFNLHLNNTLVALTARKYGMPVAPQIVGDTEVCELLRTSHAKDFELADLLEEIEEIQKIAEIADLAERERKTDLLRWQWLDDHSFFHYFGVERLWVFLIKLEMIDRWLKLDKETGSALFRKFIQDLKEEVSIPQV